MGVGAEDVLLAEDTARPAHRRDLRVWERNQDKVTAVNRHGERAEGVAKSARQGPRGHKVGVQVLTSLESHVPFLGLQSHCHADMAKGGGHRKAEQRPILPMTTKPRGVAVSVHSGLKSRGSSSVESGETLHTDSS